MKFLLHNKRAETHEKTLDKIEDQLSSLSAKVTTDKAATTTALKVLTEEISRLEIVNSRIARFLHK